MYGPTEVRRKTEVKGGKEDRRTGVGRCLVRYTLVFCRLLRRPSSSFVVLCRRCRRLLVVIIVVKVWKSSTSLVLFSRFR